MRGLRQHLQAGAQQAFLAPPHSLAQGAGGCELQGVVAEGGHGARNAPDFIVAAGHQSVAIKQFFANYHLMANDVRVALDTGEVELHPTQGAGWTVSIVDTGLYSTNSARLCLLRKWIGAEPFMVAYADSLANLDVQEMLEFHNSHGKLATVAAVRPPARAGNLELLDARVTAFTRNVRRSETWINGGFLILEPAVFDYLLDDQVPLEAGPLAQLRLRQKGRNALRSVLAVPSGSFTIS